MNKPLEFCDNKNLKLSYVARVISSLWQFGEHAMNELEILLKASWRCRLLGRIYGFWMDSDDENSPLFFVSEGFDKNLFDVIMDDEMKKRVKMSEEEMVSFWDICVGCCTTVLSLHSEGMVCGGCLAPSNFCFDELGRCVLDLSSILNTCRESKKCDMLKAGKAEAFTSPETFLMLCGACKKEDSVSYSSDIWSLACILSGLLLGDLTLPQKLFEDCSDILSRGIGGNFAETIFSIYDDWRQKMVSLLGDLLTGTRFESLVEIVTLCLDGDPYKRPSASEFLDWIRSLCVKSCGDSGCFIEKRVRCCLLLNKLYSTPKEALKFSSDEPNEGAPNAGQSRQEKDNGGVIGGLLGRDLEFATLKGHRDCVTGLAVGGGYLFSSSFDKTINVWSLQGYTHVKTLKGHEHRVTAILVVNMSQQLCISGDSGSGIFLWDIDASFDHGPWKKWYEHNDWRYSGIHCLAFSETGYLYSGSGDKSIKAWSLQDYSLSYTMNGHKSTVSCLTVGNGILYSGSWDGTIRMWWLHDHSPLAVLTDDSHEGLSPVLSLMVDRHYAISSYENGTLKIWKDDVLKKSFQIQKGSIFALHMQGKWIFTGGLDKIIDIQELSENETQFEIRSVASLNFDEVVTTLLYWNGNLFVGSSGKDIKVYYSGV